MKLLALFGMLILISGVTFGQGDEELVTDDKAIENEDDMDTAEPTTPPADAPSSTTVAPPPAPTPVDPKTDKKPKLGKFHLSEKNKTCIVLEMATRLKFTYRKNDTNKTKDATVMWDIPTGNETKVGGACSIGNTSDVQMIELTFFEDWKLTVTFNRTSDKQYYISDLTLQYVMDPVRFPNTTENATGQAQSSKAMKMYKVDKDKSFKCESEETISDFKGGNLTSLMTWDLHVQAFRSNNNTDFGDAVYCDGDTKVSNLVPIIVGAALAGLVLIVLVAYLIGRHRNRQGYQSV